MELMKVGFTAAVTPLFIILAAGNKAGAPRDTDNENQGCYESMRSFTSGLFLCIQKTV